MFSVNLLFCVKTVFDKDYCGLEHTHPCYELVYYINGKGDIKIGEKQNTFEKDTFMLSLPNEKHLEKGCKDTEVLYIGFETDCEQIRQGVFYEKDFNILENLRQIYYESKHWSRYSYQLINMYTEIIILKLINKQIDGHQQDVNRDMNKIAGYISANYKESISVAELAEKAGYSYDHFRRVFLAAMGISVNDFILHKRLENAFDMLASKRYFIKQIATECGFSSVSQFCIKFKQVMGDTPTNVLERMNNGEELNINLFFPEKANH